MDKDKYYLGIAYSVAKKSTCLRKHYGAVIVKNDEIISTGYNGPPRGEKHCEICTKINSGVTRQAQRDFNASDSKISCENVTTRYNANKDFEEYLSCRSVHAEMNAIISAARRDMIDADLYLAGWQIYEFGVDTDCYPMDDPEPCEICLRLIKNAGIARVITEKGIVYERNISGNA